MDLSKLSDEQLNTLIVKKSGKFTGDLTSVSDEVLDNMINKKMSEQPKSLFPIVKSLDFGKTLQRTFEPYNPLTSEGRLNLITGIAPIKSVEAMGEAFAEVGVPAMQTVPFLKNIPFGARIVGDPRVLSGFLTGRQGKEAIKTGGKELLKRTPRIMGKDYTLNRAQTLAKDLKDLRIGYGSLKEDMLSKVGNAQTNAPAVYKILAKLPDAVIQKFDDVIYGIKRTSKGAYDTTVKNVDRMREAIGDLLSSKDWIEATKVSKGQLRHIFNELGNYMKEASPEVGSSLDAYSNFMRNIYRPAEKTLFRSGQIVEKPLRGAVKAGAERTTQKALEGLSKSVKTSRQALKDMAKFTSRQNIKNILLKTALYGGGGGSALYGLGRVFRNR